MGAGQRAESTDVALFRNEQNKFAAGLRNRLMIQKCNSIEGSMQSAVSAQSAGTVAC
jgi:hypothetical protein